MTLATQPLNLDKILQERLQSDRAAIEEFCKQYKITEFSLFGSVLRDDFNPQTSDIDILVDFDEAARHTLLDFVEMKDQLTEIFEHKVDLVSREGIERGHNTERKHNILSSAQTIYDARSTASDRHADLSTASHELPQR